jgi:hypothetical protein
VAFEDAGAVAQVAPGIGVEEGQGVGTAALFADPDLFAM